MAGFVLIADLAGRVRQDDSSWTAFVGTFSEVKDLPEPYFEAAGSNCLAAKFDAQCSLHRGITTDSATGSWLLVTGTVVDVDDPCPNGELAWLLADFLKQGAGVFSRLDGQFSLVAYNGLEERLYIVSDPFGMIPIYYAQDGTRLYFSTSALAVGRMVKSEMDEWGIHAFLAYGTTFGNTFWKGIKRVPAATHVSIQHGKIHEELYWEIELDPSLQAMPEEKAVDHMVGIFAQSMRSSLGREGKVWVSVTGGMDSRTLAALTHYCQIPFLSYCHGPVDSKDVRIAAEISRRMKWDHQYFALPADWGTQRYGWLDRSFEQTDGHLDVIKMSRTIREQVLKGEKLGVSVWGYGGEIYRGYYWKQEFGRIGKTSEVNYQRFLDMRIIPANQEILEDGKRWNRLLRDEVLERLHAIGERHSHSPNSFKLDLIGQFLEQHACGITAASVLGHQRVILPFYFKMNIQSALSLNYRWRNYGRLFRLMLEKINPTLAQMVTADGGPALAMRFSNMYRFIPYWMDSLNKYMWRILYRYGGREFWARRDAGPAGRSYPIKQWFDDTVGQIEGSGLLDGENMKSKYLYVPEQLRSLITGTQGSAAANESFIGRIIAVEMAHRWNG